LNPAVSIEDCRFCCRPRGHRGDCCALCLERSREQRCSRKRAYVYLSDAQDAAGRTGVALKVYRCSFGAHWHVGHEVVR
jgi:hypothetical protein